MILPPMLSAQGPVHLMINRISAHSKQGRRNKDPDTCYSFWVGATLNMLGKFDFVDNASNAMFHASCQFMYGTMPCPHHRVLKSARSLFVAVFANAFAEQCRGEKSLNETRD